MAKPRRELPGQTHFNFEKKYDPPVSKPIEPSQLGAYRIITKDGTFYLELWPYGATIRDVRAHFKRIHPEHKRFKVGVIGVGEFIVDSIEHAWIPDARMIDQRGRLVVEPDAEREIGTNKEKQR
jgi:hypothetical protein